MVSLIRIAVAISSIVLTASARSGGKTPVPPAAIASKVELAKTGNFTFTQFIDHKNPGLGTFQQRVWYNDQFYNGPGSPVVFFTPGEIAADGYTGYLTNATITGLYAQAIGGAVIMVEHRYWGKSSPYDDLTTKNLQYLTLDQAIADFTYLAKNVQLPFDPTGSSLATRAPWVFSGGSYSGALAAWTASTAPGTFWAYHASSAPVEAIFDYWQYFVPVQQGMPKNCSADVSRVINHIDHIFAHGSQKDQTALKAKFGLETLANDDFGGAIENGPWEWQGNSFYSNYSLFYQFCDAIENVQAGAAYTPDANGVGLEKALDGYASWIKANIIPGYCQGFGYTDKMDLSCFNTHDPNNKIFTDRTVDNTIDRQWNWMLCNEPFGYWQDGAPKGKKTLVSRLVNAHYYQRQCDLFFPREGQYTYGSNRGLTVNDVNKKTKGWFLTDTTRLIWTNGEFDPWRTSGVSSEFRPGGPLKSTPKAPVQIIPGGFHCSDLRAKNGIFNAGVQKVIDNEIKQIKTWVDEYYHK